MVVNPDVDGPLDLIPENVNSIPADAMLAFLMKASKSGDLAALSLSVDIRGPLTSATTRAAGYKVYIAANAGGDGHLAWYQLDANRNWSDLSWPTTQFISGSTLSSKADSVIVQILDGVDVSALAGLHIYVGYGTDADEMLRAGRYREVMTISSQQ